MTAHRLWEIVRGKKNIVVKREREILRERERKRNGKEIVSERKRKKIVKRGREREIVRERKREKE